MMRYEVCETDDNAIAAIVQAGCGCSRAVDAGEMKEWGRSMYERGGRRQEAAVVEWVVARCAREKRGLLEGES